MSARAKPETLGLLIPTHAVVRGKKCGRDCPNYDAPGYCRLFGKNLKSSRNPNGIYTFNRCKQCVDAEWICVQQDYEGVNVPLYERRDGEPRADKVCPTCSGHGRIGSV